MAAALFFFSWPEILRNKIQLREIFFSLANNRMCLRSQFFSVHKFAFIFTSLWCHFLLIPDKFSFSLFSFQWVNIYTTAFDNVISTFFFSSTVCCVQPIKICCPLLLNQWVEVSSPQILSPEQIFSCFPTTRKVHCI